MEGPPPSPEKKENEPGSYEYALALFKRLKEEGVRNPFNLDNMKVQEAKDALDEYEGKEGLRTAGVGDMERAQKLVRSARLLLEAGFTGTAVREDVKERLDDLHAFALRENDPEVTAYIADELEKLEPKSAMDKKIEAKLAEAAAAAKPTDAVGILALALIDPRFKRMSSEQRVQIVQAKEDYKKK